MPNEQLEAKLTAPGSTLDCAFRRLPDTHRLPCLGLFHLHDELRNLVFNRSETVYVQYGWWHEECARLLSGQPRHPATQAIMMWQQYAETDVCDWLRNLESSMGLSAFNDEAELLNLCASLTRPLFVAYSKLMLDLYNDEDRSLKDRDIDRISVAYTLFHFMQNLGQYLRQGIIPIPRSELSDQITAGDLLARRVDSAFQNTMQVQYDRVSKLHADLCAKTSSHSVRNQPVISTIVAIHQATLREIQRSHYSVIDNHIDITPLRKTWIAWNAYRRATSNIAPRWLG